MKVLRYWKVVLGLVLVFAAGAVSGALATRHLLARGLSKALNFERWKAGTMEVLQDKLKLTPPQHQKIEQLVDERGHEIRATFATTFQQCGHTMVQLQHQIDQELTPQQREVHDEMKRAFRAELKKKFNFDLPEE
jgi:Spy/CpxP family protein refolding chaperone